MQTRRGGIQRDVTSSRSILQAAEAIRPRIQEWNAGSASFDAGGIEIIHATQKLNSTEAKERTDYPSRGPECCLQVTSRKDVRGRAAHVRPPARCERIVGYSEAVAGTRHYSRLSIQLREANSKVVHLAIPAQVA